jgi:putative ABC transport system permease protein
MMPDTFSSGAIPLSVFDLSIAAGLVLVAGSISLLFRLGLERRLALASVRTVAQLLLVGYVLQWVFDPAHVLMIIPIVVVMVAVASRSAVVRASRSYAGVTWRAFGTLVLTSLITTVIVTGIVIGAEPWYGPQYLIPLLGMVLGNSLNGISLCLDSLLEYLSQRRDEIEMHLSLGASRWEAARDALRDAVRRGMIPIINSMMVVGIVALPGMMTGQILQGADPLQAVKYQIVVMFMIAGATSAGCRLPSGAYSIQRISSGRRVLDGCHGPKETHELAGHGYDGLFVGIAAIHYSAAAAESARRLNTFRTEFTLVYEEFQPFPIVAIEEHSRDPESRVDQGLRQLDVTRSRSPRGVVPEAQSAARVGHVFSGEDRKASRGPVDFSNERRTTHPRAGLRPRFEDNQGHRFLVGLA